MSRWWLPWVGVVALALWTAIPGPWPLVLAAIAFVASLHGLAPEERFVRGAIAAGVIGVVVGFAFEVRTVRILDAGGAVSVEEEDAIRVRLAAELDRIVDRSLDAVTTLAAEVAEGNGGDPEVLRRIRMRGGFDGVAVFDSEGRLESWDGDHRGRIPEEVRLGVTTWHYGDLPLAGHFYVTRPLDGGGTAMVSTLLQSDLPAVIRGREGDFVQRYTQRTGDRLEILRPERLGDRRSTFAWRVGDETLFSVVLDRPAPAERIAALRVVAGRAGMAFVLVVWGLLLAAGRGARTRRRVAVAALPVLALLLPPEAIPGLSRLADPAFADLPGPISPGHVVLLLLAGLVVTGLVGVRGLPRTGPLVAGAGAALLVPATVALFRSAAAPELLSVGEAGFLGWTLVLGGVVAVVAWAVLATAPTDRRDPGRVAMIGVAVAALTAVAATLAVGRPGVPAWLPGVWAIPLVLLRGRLGEIDRDGTARLAVVVAAVAIGMSVSLPVAWGDRIDARRAAAESDLERLGTGPDAALESLLRGMGRSVERLDAIGARPVELLYEGWRDSGLAEAGYPVWLTLWSPGGLPEEDLPVGTQIRARPGVADAFLDDVVASDTISVRRFENADAHYLLQVPLRGGWVVTGVVPPLRSFGGNSLLGPLLGDGDAAAEDPLTLVPLLRSEVDDEGSALRWVRSEAGWRAELGLAYPGEGYTAHYDVPVAGPLVAVARAGLLLLIAVGLAALLHGLGRALQGVFRRGGWRPPWASLRTFRGRITIALFAFFAVSNLGFGTLTYRTIAGASERAAEVLAERVVQEAESVYSEVQGQIDFLAQQVGSELLEFSDASLREGSLDPLVELGLYQGWVPYDVHTLLTRREIVQATRRTGVGGGAYVTAYRRLPDGDVIAAPVPLRAGAAAVRAREVIHLLAFAMLGGALLSLVLALLTGRALARPIQTLRVASERVGSGNLQLRLPEERDDEFGRVFVAFNRMVRRLHQARRSLLRTTQRTRAIVEDSATGVVALDAKGRVTLVNPRALELLGDGLVEEEPIEEAIARASDAGTEAVLNWIQRWQAEGPRETSADLQVGGRRLRVRGRRITREGPAEGVVVNLEDVTDELRAERVIAWGEMARQVAHEVKNPLTPIKLSIQHIRRAWADGRPDFEEIMARNADAMLAEIDRLAEIASGFSRFGAPGEAEAELESVDLERAIGDVLALYSGPKGQVRFEGRVDGPLPPVRARVAEVKEVLVNLLENARAAVSGKGLVTVHAFLVEGAVRLQVVDDGSGIPEEILGRIFEPQFSTRSTGTGLGLAIVRRLVERWGGTIEARSRVGEGSAFMIDLRVWDGVDPGEGPVHL